MIISDTSWHHATLLLAGAPSLTAVLGLGASSQPDVGELHMGVADASPYLLVLRFSSNQHLYNVVHSVAFHRWYRLPEDFTGIPF